jgi:hydroxymethylbilane synthase
MLIPPPFSCRKAARHRRGAGTSPEKGGGMIRIGTRGSKLALAQASEVRQKLERLCPDHNFKIVIIKTRGDEYQSVEAFKKTHVGVFTKEIEKQLLSGVVDIAVHSLKDLPTDLAKGLKLVAIPRRASAQDVLISRRRYTLKSLPQGARVGTGSPRRKRQLMLLRPDLNVMDIRGNLDTRVAKVLKEKSLDAVMVARAGLERLGKFKSFCRVVPAKTVLPAVGQGALGLEIRANNPSIEKIARLLNHPESEILVNVERRFLKELHGGCRVPVGILAQKVGTKIHLKAAVFSVQNSAFVEAQMIRPFSQALQAGKTLARELLKMGARHFLLEARPGP